MAEIGTPGPNHALESGGTRPALLEPGRSAG